MYNYVRNSRWLLRLTLILGFVFVFAFQEKVAHAATTVHYDCSNISVGSGICSGGVFTFSGGGDEVDTDSSSYSFGVGVPVYLSYTAVSSGVMRVNINNADTSSNVGPFNLTGSQSDYPMTPVSGNPTYIQFYDNGSFIGTVSDLCITDTPGGCGSPTPPTPGPTSFNCVKDASSTSCLVQVQDNPTLDFFLGIFTFMGGLIFMVWLFKMRR